MTIITTIARPCERQAGGRACMRANLGTSLCRPMRARPRSSCQADTVLGILLMARASGCRCADVLRVCARAGACACILGSHRRFPTMIALLVPRSRRRKLNGHSTQFQRPRSPALKSTAQRQSAHRMSQPCFIAAASLKSTANFVGMLKIGKSCARGGCGAAMVCRGHSVYSRSAPQHLVIGMRRLRWRSRALADARCSAETGRPVVWNARCRSA